MLLLAGAGCTGDGADFAPIETAVVGTCAKCHTAAGYAELLAAVEATPEAELTGERFPDGNFVPELAGKHASDLAAAADPPADAGLAPELGQRKAWLLHELHRLELVLVQDPPADFTSRETFDAFAVGGGACVLVEKLDHGLAGHPTGMPTLWGPELFAALGQDYAGITDDDRHAISAYLVELTPKSFEDCGAGDGHNH